jgi:hypothetical protein
VLLPRLAGASSKELRDISHAVSVIELANRNRVTSATAMNDASSRSHSVLLVDVTTRVGAKVLRGKLHLVDLAGSVRLHRPHANHHHPTSLAKNHTRDGRCASLACAVGWCRCADASRDDGVRGDD